MFEKIYNLYHSTDLPGELLQRPLKRYYSFFASKVFNDPLKKICKIIAHIVSGIFCYPLFGGLAAIGMLVKLTGIRGLNRHNNLVKENVESIRTSLVFKTSSIYAFAEYHHEPGWDFKPIRTFFLTKQDDTDLTKEINKEIDIQTSQYKKIYLTSQMIINENNISIPLMLNVRVHS